MRRRTTRALAAAAGVAAVIGMATPASACGGLIGPNGAVNLLRTSTLAGYANGVEHYVTAFKFSGGGGKFGSIIPLPGVPSKVERGGDWTLQRLDRETTPVLEFAADSAAGAVAAPKRAEVLLTVKVDALDITVLKGGGSEVATWAREHGFRLSPDAPEVLDFYANRSPIFLAAAFDGREAARRGQKIGDGTPVHISIPTTNPWVPLRILALGKQPLEPVEADVYLLTPRRPALLGDRQTGISRVVDVAANEPLLSDLHTDRSGGWVPLKNMWLTKLAINSPAQKLRYDLAIDTSGQGAPSWVAAGIALAAAPIPAPATIPGASNRAAVWWVLVAGLVLGATVGGLALARRTP